jgi:hypothetical protein
VYILRHEVVARDTLKVHRNLCAAGCNTYGVLRRAIVHGRKAGQRASDDEGEHEEVEQDDERDDKGRCEQRPQPQAEAAGRHSLRVRSHRERAREIKHAPIWTALAALTSAALHA